MNIPFGRVAAISEPQPYTVAVTLDDGHVIELSRMGAMRTQLLAELRDARAAVAAADAGAVGKAEVFPGWVGDGAVEVHVHDDALLLVADAWTRRLAFSFVDRAVQENYAVEVALSGGSSMLISRLGRRTGELRRIGGGTAGRGAGPDSGVPRIAAARAGPDVAALGGSPAA